MNTEIKLYSIRQLVDMVSRQELNPNPIGQRPPTTKGWKKSQRIVESIIDGYGCGMITIRDISEEVTAQDIYGRNCKFLCVDGGHRLRALRDFRQALFTVKGKDFADYVEEGINIDEIEVLKISGKKIEFDIKMEKPKKDSKVEVTYYTPSVSKDNGKPYDKISTSLFTVNYNKIETDSSYIFQRTLNLKPAHIKKEEIKNIYDDCVKLNSIKNSSIIISK